MRADETITVPAGLSRTIGAWEGEAGRRWIAGLPALVRSLCAEWGLRIDGAPLHGCVALVLPVARGAERCMLKVSWLDVETEHEGLALATWGGRGAVRLLGHDASRGALLLERLDHARSLGTVPVEEAVDVAARLLRRLAVPAPPQVRRCADYALRQVEQLPAENAALGYPVPATVLDAALACARRLAPSAGTLLVNEDLHYENVLAGDREPWLMIDPKPVAGDPEAGLLALLYNRFDEGPLADRLARLIDRAGLDAERAHGWTLLRAVDNWLWGLGVGELREAGWCAEIARWLSRQG